MLNFYRGLRKDYPSSINNEHSLWDGIYFATDTFEIIVNGQTFGLDPNKVKNVAWDKDNPKVIKFTKTVFNEATGNIDEEIISFNAGLSNDDQKAIAALQTFMEDGQLTIGTYNTTVPDGTKVALAVGGIAANVDVSTLKGLSITSILNKIFFPAKPITVDTPKCTLALNGISSTMEITATAPGKDKFTVTYVPGNITCNGVKLQNATAGGPKVENSENIYYTTNSTTAWPTQFSEPGTYDFYATVAYTDGSIPKNNLGEEFPNLQKKAATTAPSAKCSINVTMPVWVTNVTDKLNKLTLQAWSTSTNAYPAADGNEATGIKLIPSNAGQKSKILIPGTLLHVYGWNVMSKKYDLEQKDNFDTGHIVTEADTEAWALVGNINGITGKTYYLYTWNADPIDTLNVRIIF